MSEYSVDLSSQLVSRLLPMLSRPSTKKAPQNYFRPLIASVSSHSVELSSSDIERAEEIAKQKAEERVQALVNSAIQSAEASKKSLEEKLIQEDTPGNQQAYQEAIAHLTFVSSDTYRSKVHSDNFQSFYREEYPSALEQVKQEKIAKIRAATNGEIDKCALSIGLMPAIGRGTEAIGYGNNPDMDIRAHLSAAEVPGLQVGGYLHFRFSLNAAEYQRGEFFKGADANSSIVGFAQIPIGVNVGGFIRLSGCIDTGKVEVCPSSELGFGIDPLHIIGGTVYGLRGGGLGVILGFGYGVAFSPEGYLDAGVNIGPVGIRGGIYPNARSVTLTKDFEGLVDNQVEGLTKNQKALIFLNPGLRIEWTF